MIKKIVKIFLVLFFLFFLVLPIKIKAADEIPLYFFWSKGCPHCAQEKVFLEKLEKKYPQLIIKDFEISSSQENIKLLQKASKEFNANIPGVPFTAVGENYIVGFLDEETTGQQIEEAVNCAIENRCPDIVGSIIDPAEQQKTDKNRFIPQTLDLPIIGKLNTKNISLPILTIIFGLLDGFNPCAMWTLLFLISLLLGMKDRKRMWTLGVVFIISSAFVYFLFMAAWLNLFLLLGFVIWIRAIIGLVALGAGGYSVRDWYINKNGSCKVVDGKKRKRVFEKLKNITKKRQLLLALGGIILLAFAVNLVELVCSAGLPAVYTQILSLNKLSSFQYYLYLLLYIFFFMLDDLFVFFIAMSTLKMVGIESKYSRFSRLFGGLIMLGIGILLIFKPEWLMFG